MRLRSTYDADSYNGSLVTILMRVGGIFQMLGNTYLIYAVTPTMFDDNVVRLIVSIFAGVFSGLFTMGFATLIDDIHAIRIQTAGYEVDMPPEPEPETEPEPEPEPEVVEQPARHGKRKAQRAQPEDYDPYDVDQ